MKIADTKISAPGTPFRVRTNHTGRRTYSRDYKLEIVAECGAPGASIAAIALSQGINANVVRRWIVQHRRGVLNPTGTATPGMLPITLAPAGKLASHARAETGRPESKRCPAGIIEIELEVARIRVRGAVDGAPLSMVLEMLAQR